MHPRRERAGKRTAPQGWDIDQLNRLLGSARTMPGEIAAIPAGKWWPALLLSVLDTGSSIPPLLTAPLSAYDHCHGRLTLGLIVYELHTATVSVIDLIRQHGQQRLFPWPWDNGRSPFYILHRRYRELLYRADLPPVRCNQFNRLQRTPAELPGSLNLSLPFTPRPGEYKHPRARDLRPKAPRSESGATPEPESHETAPPPKRRRSAPVPELVPLSIDTPRTLLRFLKDSYIPFRLVGCSDLTIEQWNTAIGALRRMMGREPTLDDLSDDLIQEYQAFETARGIAPATINSRVAHYLALWRFAWRRKLLDHQPRGVMKLRVPKRTPEADPRSVERRGSRSTADDRGTDQREHRRDTGREVVAGAAADVL